MYRRDMNQEYQQIIDRVTRMPQDSEARRLAEYNGLSINNITWEDNARNKNSSFGPCISDMTLCVEGNLPVIRPPNYQDLTWDVDIEKIPLVVGNERDEILRTVTLKEYLRNYRDYLHKPDWNSPHPSLLAPRDTHVLMSSQACFLPVPKEGGEAKFNVALKNYQSSKGYPAVLVIVANERGSSAQIIENEGYSSPEKLFFNKNGEKCSFLGQRLSEHRIEEGREHDLGKPMSAEEKQKNMILIIQVPLKVNKPFVLPPSQSMSFASPPMACMAKTQMRKCSSTVRECADVEDAIIKVGESEGRFKELGGIQIERNPDYPVRVTLQYYKATSNGIFGNAEISAISEQLKESRKFASSIGSLVVGGTSTRPTEPVLASPSVRIPPWWSEFWLTYGSLFPQWKSDDASRVVFHNGRFTTATMNSAQDQILDLLGKTDPQRQNQPSPPVWSLG